MRAGFFEIYRGKCADLLNKKKKIEVGPRGRGRGRGRGRVSVRP